MSGNKLKLKDIYFGAIDAKHELLNDSQEERENFSNSFLTPQSVNKDDFYNGRKYYVYGLKGTGKTALLRFFNIEFEKIKNVQTSFILFKSDFNEEDRKDFHRAASLAYNTTQIDTNIDKEHDFEQIWRWFLHRHIVETIESKNLDVFEKNEEWHKYKRHVLALKLENDKTGLRTFLPKIKKGNVELNVAGNKLGLDFEFSDKEEKRVSFSTIVKVCDKLFNELIPAKHKLYIFLDELELSYMNKKMYVRDSKLIRDLIIVIDKFNKELRKKQYNIFIISSVRSEVLNAVSSTGKEINKIIEDFGVNISWHQACNDLKEHPLIKIIVKRIELSEKKFGVMERNRNMWEKYFAPNIQKIPTESYILWNSWYRPRDVVRFFKIAQEKYPNEEKFSQVVFDAIRKTYSEKCWVECIEELKAKYSADKIDSIFRLLLGYQKIFTLQQFKSRWRSQSELYSMISDSIKENEIPRVLEDLYSSGIIGNCYTLDAKNTGGLKRRNGRIRFSFRGDDSLLLDKSMMVHNALHSYLALDE